MGYVLHIFKIYVINILRFCDNHVYNVFVQSFVFSNFITSKLNFRQETMLYMVCHAIDLTRVIWFIWYLFIYAIECYCPY